MTPEQFQRASTIFLAARALEPMEREAYVHSRCAGDDQLAAAVQGLLDADASASGAMHTQAMSSAIRDAANDAIGDLTGERAHADDEDDRMPEQIGPYRVIRLIGRGGMGAVYEAEQDVPRRRVAIKMIRAGVVSPDVLRRFRHEIEVLGRLHHPGIAQVFDAGTFDQGDGAQPYFAMEFIDGLPLVDHASRHDLPVRDRLELVAGVADAVEHAHRAGVIHRDLKPGNILVSESGDQALPKILDFGVARAIDPDARLTTVQTNVGQIIGTLAYMSPEQAGGDPLAVDPRTDVYALGVIAYELLSGRLPLDVSGRGIQEAMRIVTEEEPASLSTINRSLRGDVDTVIATALAKEPERRYPSAAALAADIRRFLHDEPIVARPASTIYQLRKFARRNRGLVTGVALAFVLLIVAVIGTSIGMVRADRQRQVAETENNKAQQIRQLLERMISSADVYEGRGPDFTVREALDEAARWADAELAGEPEVSASVLRTIGKAYFNLGLHDEAETYLRQSLAMYEQAGLGAGPDAILALSMLGMTHSFSGRYDEAEAAIRRAIELHGEEPDDVLATLYGDLARVFSQRREPDEAERLDRISFEMFRDLHGLMHEETLTAMHNVASVIRHQARPEEADKIAQEVLRLREEFYQGDHPLIAQTLNLIALILEDQGDIDGAIEMHRKSLEMRRRFLGNDHRDVAIALNNLGGTLSAAGRQEEAEEALFESLEIRKRILPPDHPNTLTTMNNLVALLYRQRKYEEADRICREVLAARRRVEGDVSEAVASSLLNLAVMVRRTGDHEQSLACLNEAVEISRQLYPHADPRLVDRLKRLARGFVFAERHAEALPLFEETYEILRSLRGPDHAETLDVRKQLGSCLLALSRNEEAEQVLIETYESASTARGAETDESREIARLLSDMYRNIGDTDAAAAWQARAAD